MKVSLQACNEGHVHLWLLDQKNERIGEAVLSRKEAAEVAEMLLHLALPEDARETMQ